MCGPQPVSCRLVFAQVDHPDFVSNAVLGEIDDDVIALGDALFVKFGDQKRSRHQVTVVADPVELRTITESNLEEAGNAGIQDAETILAAFHFKV